MLPSSQDGKLKLVSFSVLLFYALYTLFLISHFTFSQGLFFAFSLLGLLGLSLSGLLKNPQLAVASLSLAVPQLVIWFLDVISLSIFKSSFLGTAEGHFQPGVTTLEFIISYYPLFILPAAVVIIKHLPRVTKPPVGLTSLITFIGLLLSRFVFKGIADPNCSKLSCMEGFNKIPVVYYPWAFLLFYTVLCSILSVILTYYFNLSSQRAPFRRYPKLALSIYGLFCLSLITFDIQKFKHSPRFTCTSLPPVAGVSTECKYTLDYSPGFFSLFFSAENRSPAAKHCNFYLLYKDKKETMYGAVLLNSNESITSSIILPYPSIPEGASVSVTSECVVAE